MNGPAAGLQNVNAPNGRLRASWRIIALLMLVVAVGHFNRIAISVAGTERIIPGGRISPTQMGQIYSAFLLLYTLAMAPAGLFIDRFGGRASLVLLTFGSALFVLATGAAGFYFEAGMPLWLALLAVRSLMGVVNSPLHPAAARLVFQHVPRGATSAANGLVTCAACAGIASTWYGFGAMIDRWDWPRAFLVCGFMTLAAALAWTFLTRDLNRRISSSGQSAPEPERDTSVFAVVCDRGVLCLTASYAALGYFQYLFFYWGSYYFETIQGLGVDVSRRYSTFITLAMGVGMLLGGWLADRVSGSLGSVGIRRFVPLCGMIASGLVFELGAFSRDSQVTFAAFTLSAGLLGMSEAAFWTTIVELGGRRGGMAAGLMNMGGNAGGTLSPTLTPLLGAFFAEHVGTAAGWRISLAIAGVVPIIGALLWLGFTPRHDDRPASAQL